MKIENNPFTLTDFTRIAPQTVAGETGSAIIRSFEQGAVRVRLAEYSAGYLADHWCLRGHIVYVIKGEIDILIEDGRVFHLTEAMSFQVADGIDAHKARSENGATVFIAD